MARPTNQERDEKILKEIQERLKYCQDDQCENSNRDAGKDDLRFAFEEGAQWDTKTRVMRGQRPTYTYNRCLGALNQVIGDQRQNRASIKVRAVDNKADPKTAEVLGGLIRNIEQCSDADTAYDTAFKHALGGNFGCWRILPEYVSDGSFDQELRIRRIANPYTVHFDPDAEDFEKRDASYVIIERLIARDLFEEQYPGLELTSMPTMPNSGSWFQDDRVLIAEYFKKVKTQGTLALLSDGRVVDYDADFRKVEDELAADPKAPVKVESKREVTKTVIRWYKVSGADVLEGPIDYKWKYIPVIPVFGRTVNIDGDEIRSSLIRPARDPQVSYNFVRSNISESVLSQPKTPWKATPRMIRGFEQQYETAHANNWPVMLYNVDPESPLAVPVREPPAPVPVGLVALTQLDADDIRAATGYYQASLGEASNEKSGVAIENRQREGDVGSFEFPDNLRKAIRFTGECLVDMIPSVYDTERQLRILGEDGKEDFVAVNQEVVDQQTGKKKLLHDLRQGTYDVAVSTGPSYTTQRQEAAAVMLDLGTKYPIVAQLGADVIVKNLDAPGMDELVKRIRAAYIKQGLVEPTDEEKADMPPPAPPDPAQEAIKRAAIASAMGKAGQEMAKAQGLQLDNQAKPVELQKLISEIVATQIASMVQAGQIGIAPSGEYVLMEHVQADADRAVQVAQMQSRAAQAPANGSGQASGGA